jgi:hypothetical protein
MFIPVIRANEIKLLCSRSIYRRSEASEDALSDVIGGPSETARDCEWQGNKCG